MGNVPIDEVEVWRIAKHERLELAGTEKQGCFAAFQPYDRFRSDMASLDGSKFLRLLSFPRQLWIYFHFLK